MLTSLLRSLFPAALAEKSSPYADAETKRPLPQGPFARELAKLVAGKIHVLEDDNFDQDRFVKGLDPDAREAHFAEATFQDILRNTPEYSAVHEALGDPASRDWFTQLVAYRLLGRRHVKLATNTPEHWQTRAIVKGMSTQPFTGLFGPLSDFEVDFAGERLRVAAWWSNVAWSFYFRQYYFSRDGISVAPEADDRVVDAGVCFGDTALGFAAAVGKHGRVVGFEIDPANVRVAQRNVELNPALGERVRIHECALAHAEIPLYLDGSGPGARVSTEPSEHKLQVTTIDRLIDTGELDRVDFIKMDIEGAERRALAGAEQTLRRFRPKLAISVYHIPNDLWYIARWIETLGLGYRLHLDHYTIHHEETVLYAVADRG